MSSMFELPKEELIARINGLCSERDRLKAELEALKPKPVVKVFYTSASPEELYGYSEWAMDCDNLKLTFEAGILVKAEVLK